MRFLLPFFTIFMLLSGCARGPFVYHVCIGEEGDVSTVTTNTVTKPIDTNLAYISGNITNNQTQEPVYYAGVSFMNLSDSTLAGTFSDSSGQYRLTAHPGIYRLKIEHIHHPKIIIDSLRLRTGELRTINAKMGKSGNFTMYEIVSKRKLSRKKLLERVQQN